jgi:FixJ family two-component response regulator
VQQRVGVGGVVAALSVTSDLTRGHPPGEAMRACLVATELARRAVLDAFERRLGIGRTKREIATELVLSPSTVHTHTVHIYAKCGVSTRAALAMFAMRHGLAASIG